MSKFTLRIRNKVTGIRQINEESALSSDSSALPVPLEYNNASEIAGTNRDNSEYLVVLKNRIKVLEQALQKAREESYQAGYEEGREAGQCEAKKQVEDIAEEFGAMARSLKDQYTKSLESMDEPLLKLAMRIAKKIIGNELRHSKDYDQILKRQIKQMLGEVVDQTKVTIHVSPYNIKWLGKVNLLDEMNIPSKAEINFVSNNSLTPGECILETEDYIIEGLLSRQLDNLGEKILDNGV